MIRRSSYQRRSRFMVRHALAVALMLIAAVGIAACGGSTTDTSTDGEQQSTGDSGDSGGDLKVGLVTDQGGLNDRSFNALAYEGAKQAEKELGVTLNVAESKTASDYSTNLAQFAQNGYDLVIAVGFLQEQALASVSAKYPDIKFAIIDPSGEFKAGPNVVSLRFKEQEAGYLAGALSGMIETDGKLKGINSAKMVSSVGGKNIPPVNRFIAGFQAGVKSTCKDCDFLNAYSEDFIASDKCKEQALVQIGKASDIIFQVAGGCGLGALQAAKDKGVWGIGVDADQSYLGSHILTSAVKKVDKSVFETIEKVKNDTFPGGTDVVYGLKEDGVGLGKITPAAAEYEAKLAPIIEKIKAGSVEIPSDL